MQHSTPHMRLYDSHVRLYNQKNTTKSSLAIVENIQKSTINQTDRGYSQENVARDIDSSSPHSMTLNGCSNPERAPHRKPSTSLTEAQVRLILNAAQHAELIDRPLNRFMTIDWELSGVTDIWDAQSRYIKLIRDWLRQKKAGPFTYVWVIESGGRHGLHSHILMHMPPTLISEFNKRQRQWLKISGIMHWFKGLVHSKPISHTYWAAFDTGTGVVAYQHNLMKLMDYVLKAADNKARRIHNVTREPQYGYVPGKRCAVSRNIGCGAIASWRSGEQPLVTPSANLCPPTRKSVANSTLTVKYSSGS